MDDHLGYEKSERSDSDDYRNGYKPKTVQPGIGEVELEVPQDRKSTFEPQMVKKGESGMIAVYNKLVSGVNIWHHPALPLLSLISVIFFEKKPKLSFKVTFLAMIPTALYALTLMILNFCRIVDGPYFFLKVYNQPWYMSIMWFVVILGVDYGLSCALWGLNGIKNKE